MIQQIFSHEFADNSGAAFFDAGSGETVVLALSKADLLAQLDDPESELLQSGNKRTLDLVYQFLRHVE